MVGFSRKCNKIKPTTNNKESSRILISLLFWHASQKCEAIDRWKERSSLAHIFNIVYIFISKHYFTFHIEKEEKKEKEKEEEDDDDDEEINCSTRNAADKLFHNLKSG